MFTGIIESTATTVALEVAAPNLRLVLKKPSHFDDLKLGDSVAVNGVCLTVSDLTVDTIGFEIGPETQVICGWTEEYLQGRKFNLERSLKLGDRLHGHWVLGHVDSVAKVTRIEDAPNWRKLSFEVTSQDARLVWRKSSVTISGVSLTVNDVESIDGICRFSVGLIPETLKRTNLSELRTSDQVNIEFDWLAKAARAIFSGSIQHAVGGLA